MDVINIGSLNLDWVYQVPHFVQPGETLSALSYNEYLGGKGLNQSIALARAGCKVAHVGAIGHNGMPLRETLEAEGVNTDFVRELEGPSGHAIIQVSPQGENSIVLFPGTNQQLSLSQIQDAIAAFPHAKAVLLQNETNALADIMQLAKEAGKFLVYNPAPIIPSLQDLPLHLVDVLIVNEIEAKSLPFFEAAITVTTKGPEGVTVSHQGSNTHFPAVPVDKVVDTTAAGDTFIGFFLSEYLKSADLARAVKLATQASSLCIMQPGAAQSIPLRSAVLA